MNEQQAIFGFDLSDEDCDHIWFRANIRKEWSSFEIALFSTKWFDYRFLHPVRATYVFAHHYRAIYKRIFAEQFDHKRAEYVKGFKGDDLFVDASAVTVSGMWRARQHADAIGCPYEIYIEAAVNKVLRLNRSNMPFVTELYQGWVLDAVQQVWAERQQGRLYVGQHDAYLNENYAGLDVQNDHHEWLFTQASTRESLARWLHRFIWRDKLLPEAKARVRFGDDAIENAREYSFV